jgi:hypothetical protein
VYAYGAELEEAGLVRRRDAQFEVVAPDAMGELLSAAALVNVAAQKERARLARAAITTAEREAEELRREADRLG